MKLFLMLTIAGIVVTSSLAQAPSPDADRQQLRNDESQYLAAKKALVRQPKNAVARKRFAIATDRFATATMTSAVLGPKVKYPKALRLYREVLKIDPSDREASNNAQMIESVYRSMHRPIPK